MFSQYYWDDNMSSVETQETFRKNISNPNFSGYALLSLPGFTLFLNLIYDLEVIGYTLLRNVS
jgi:hypothetical protein